MTTALPSPLPLTRAQACRLHTYLQTYRNYALASFMPSVDRNQTLRLLQDLQGKVIDVLNQPTAQSQLSITAEEMAVFKAMLSELLKLYSKESASAERLTTLADLAALKSALRGR